MLPRVAPPNGAPSQTSPTVAPSTDTPLDGGSNAATLASLRNRILVHLIEVLLKQMPREQHEDGSVRGVLEILLEVLKATPHPDGRGADSIRKLADILNRVPPEARAAVETLIKAALTALPSKVLAEIIRNPDGPAAQKLAAFLQTFPMQAGADAHPPSNISQPRFPAYQTRWIAEGNAGRGTSSTSFNPPAPPADARILQAALKRLFEIEPELGSNGDVESLPPLRKADGEGTGRLQTSGNLQPLATERGGKAVPASSAQKVSGEAIPVRSPAANSGAEPQPSSAAIAENGQEIPDTRQLLQARAADMTGALDFDTGSDTITRLIGALLSNLTEDETRLLKSLLGAPLPEQQPGESDEHLEIRIARALEQAGRQTGEIISAESLRTIPRQAGEDSPSRQTAPSLPTGDTIPKTADTREDKPVAAIARETPAAAADGGPDNPLQQPLLRDGTPSYAFVPYPGAPEEFDEQKPAHEREEEQPAAEDDEQAASGQDEENGADEDASSGHEDKETERKREKIADLVGPPDPGFVFYQKLGDYWT